MNNSQQQVEIPIPPQHSNSSFDNELNNNYDQTQFREYNIPTENNKPLKSDISEARHWITLTQYLPVDTVTRHVNVPVKETKIVHTPKVEYVEKVKEVPKYVIQQENKVIEVPEIQYVDNIQYEPYIIEKLKYVPKEVIQYNLIKKPVVKNIINEKKVDVIHRQEQIKYKTQEIVEEVYNHYDPYQNKRLDSSGNTINSETRSQLEENLNAKFENPRFQYVDDNNTLPPILDPFGNQIQVKENPVMEEVLVPKVEKVVEIKKKIDIPIDFPVPYIVPKPNIVDVEVPVFKFNDKYVPVPIRKKIIPKIKWSDERYVVDCVIEKPYLVYHDIIKIVPTDSKITVREYPKGISRIHPGSLSEQDNLAIWMKVNADLKKEKGKETEKEKEKEKGKEGDKEDDKEGSKEGSKEGGKEDGREDEKQKVVLSNGKQNVSSYSCVCSETEEQEFASHSDINSSQECTTTKSSNENIIDTLPLHPGHPMAAVYLQNKWIKEDTLKTQNMYNERFIEAHKNAVYNLGTNLFKEAEIEASQIAAIQEKMAKDEFTKRYNDAFVN